MKTEQLATDSLVPHSKNYKLHNRKQVQAIVKSIEKNGQYRPIVVANDKKTILAGHGVHTALKRLKHKTCECFVSPHEPEISGCTPVIGWLTMNSSVWHFYCGGDQFVNFLARFDMSELRDAGY